VFPLSIDFCLAKCSEIIRRELTGVETLIVGIAYNLGVGDGAKYMNMIKDNEPKDHNK
jgi:hypothetical protein